MPEPRPSPTIQIVLTPKGVDVGTASCEIETAIFMLSKALAGMVDQRVKERDTLVKAVRAGDLAIPPHLNGRG